MFDSRMLITTAHENLRSCSQTHKRVKKTETINRTTKNYRRSKENIRARVDKLSEDVSVDDNFTHVSKGTQNRETTHASTSAERVR